VDGEPGTAAIAVSLAALPGAEAATGSYRLVGCGGRIKVDALLRVAIDL
jgi:hypothetical protein